MPKVVTLAIDGVHDWELSTYDIQASNRVKIVRIWTQSSGRTLTFIARLHPLRCNLYDRNCSLIGSWANYRGDRRRRSRAFGAAVFLCLALLALLAFVQVAHVHAVATDADHCPLCIAVHNATPVTAAAAPEITQVEFKILVPIFEPRSIVRHWPPALFTRPPPSDC